MSLRDTLEGARKEAADASAKATVAKDDAPKSKEKGEKAVPEYDQLARKRPTAAKAKPAREAGSSVHKESKAQKAARSSAGTGQSKDAQKAQKAREREHEEFRSRGYELMLRRDPEYRATEKIWWILIGVGFGFTVISLVMAYMFPNTANTSAAAGIAAIALLVLAYGFIIGGFVYDVVKRRPIRKRVEMQVNSMTDKKILDLFEQERREDAARQEQKEAQKAAKKAGKNK